MGVFGSIYIRLEHSVLLPLTARHNCSISPGKNTGGKLTYSDLELSTLDLHEATLLDVCPDANIDVPCSGSYNITTVYWCTW